MYPNSIPYFVNVTEIPLSPATRRGRNYLGFRVAKTLD